MKLSNETGLPDTLVKVAEACVNSHPVFDDSIFSVTELLRSDQQVVLSRRHAEEIVMDVQDTFSMWNGTAIHSLLEKIAGDDFITEDRFYKDLGDGLKMSGGFDLLRKSDWTLFDYKTTKVAQYDKNASGREDKWIRQLYAYADGIEEKYGRRPETAVIVAMLTDHSKMKAKAQGYPEHPIMMLSWKLDDMELAEKYRREMTERAERVRTLLKDGAEPEPCTYGDCWCTEDYAVRKPSDKRALRVFDNPTEAYGFYKTLPNRSAYRIFHRISGFVNCANYCQCAPFCKQWADMGNPEAVSVDVTDSLSGEFVPFS